jgi:PHD/YefM family antitoxin component YafN of YafNO toxin-antitoxin module
VARLSQRAYFEPILVEDGYHRWVLMSADDYDEFQPTAELMEGFSESDQLTIARFLLALRDRAAREKAGEDTTGQITSGGEAGVRLAGHRDRRRRSG